MDDAIDRHDLRPHRLAARAPRTSDVELSRVTRLIRETPPGGIVLLTAPPGSGATTAVAQALHGQDEALAWVSLDDLDGNGDRLWTQALAALSGVLGTPPADVGDRTPNREQTVAPALVDWIDAGPNLWLVIDGYDSVVHQPFHPVLKYLTANVPGNLRLAITSHDALRELPVDAVARDLRVLDGHTLALRPDESAQVVLALCPTLEATRAEAIITTSQGCVAACAAAARHADLDTTSDAAAWLANTGCDDLTRDWFARAPETGRALLEATAFLDDLCGQLCDQVLGTVGSASLLAELQGHGSYLSAADPPDGGTSDHTWYRRPPMLTAALRIHARDTADHHSRAADWFRSEGDVDATLRHLLAAGRLDEAGRYLAGFENEMFEAGEIDRAAGWYASLPAEAWGQRAWHLVRIAWGRTLTGDVPGGEVVVGQLRAVLARTSPGAADRRELEGEEALLRGYVATKRGDADTALSAARRAVDLLQEADATNSQQMAPLLLVRAHLWRGDLAAARRELTRLEGGPLATDLLREAMLGGLSAQCLIDEGRVSEARHAAHRGIAWLQDQALDAGALGQVGLLTAAAAADVEGGHAALGAARLEAAVAVALERENVGDAVYALAWQARAHAVLGDLVGAFAAVGEGRQRLRDSAPSSTLVEQLDGAEARARLLAGDPIRAERLIQRLRPSELRTLLWARLSLDRPSGAAARALTSMTTDVPRFAAERCILLAEVALRRASPLAEAHLVAAADIAEIHGLASVLVGSSPDLLALARNVGGRSGHDALLRWSGEASVPIGRIAPATTAGDSRPRAAAPALTSGELELLAHLRGHSTYGDIGATLGISINTVKTRLKRLYAKLGASSRSEAIEIARARGFTQ